MTIPQKAFFEAGLQNGSKVRVRADGPGRLIVEQVQLPRLGEAERARRERERAALRRPVLAGS